MTTHQQQIEVYQYNLNILSITMKIKFPCRMHIQNNNNILTKQITPSQNHKFVFNQEITLKQDSEKQQFQLIVHLSTDKGAKYVGGIIRLQHNQLMKSEGQRLIIQLNKCLDNDAFCELRLDQVSTAKIVVKGKPKMKPLVSEYHHEFRNKSPLNKSQQPINTGGAKSEFYFPLAGTKHKQWQKKSRDVLQIASYMPKIRSPGKNMNNGMDGEVSFQGGCHSVINPLEAEVYRQGYNKLKQKYKKQSQLLKNQQSKRIGLQNNQNNYKLQIMRLKLKCEQNQKSLQQKNSKLSNLQYELNLLQKKEYDLSFLRQQSINKDHQIRILQETVKTLQKDNNQLKLLNNNRYISDQQKFNQMKDEIYQLKLKFETKQTQMLRQIRVKSQTITKKQQQIQSKNEIIERERYSIEQLECNSQKKIFEFEKVLQNQRSTLNQKISNERQKRLSVENQKNRLQDKIKELLGQIQKIKLHINKVEYDKKILLQTNEGLKQQIEQLRVCKEKYTQLSRQFKFVSDDKTHLQKQLEKTIQSKQVNLTQLSKQHTSQVQYYKKLNKEYEEKNKQYSTKTIELESQLQMTKNQLEKVRRNLTSQQKELNEVKNKQKDLKQSIKNKDEQILTLQNQIAESCTSYKSGQQSTKFEFEKIREESDRIKTQIQSQRLRNHQLSQNNNNLASEINKLKMKLQFVEQKAQKQQSNYKDKIYNLQTQIKDNENQLNYLQQNYNNVLQSEKQLIEKIQNYELGNMSTNQTVDKLKKQIKIMEQRYNNAQNQIKNKNNDIKNLTNHKDCLEKKLQQKQNEITKHKTDLNKLFNEKNKNEKIIQMLQNDINKSKQDNTEKLKTILDKNQKEQELHEQIKRNKQEFTKLELKLGSLKKQYEKFKDLILQNVNSSFGQLPLGQITIIGSITNIKSRVLGDSRMNMSSVVNRSSENFTSEIIGLIVSNSKDVKIVLNKLIEQNKQLLRQNQRLGQDFNSTNRKALNNEQGLSQHIQQLQQQLAILLSTKEQNQIKFQDQIFNLNSKLREKQSSIKDLKMQIQQLEFTLSNLKIDLQSTQQEYLKKQLMYKKQIVELKEQIEYQFNEISILQAQTQQMNEDIFNLNTEIQSQKDNVNKKQMFIYGLQEQKDRSDAENDDLKKYRKQLLQRISSLQLQLNNEKQLKQKQIILREEEENKNQELKNFIDNLMKQKQQAIKSELEKFEQIITIQTKLAEEERDKEQIKDENQKNKKIIDESKELIKKLNRTIKELEIELNQEKSFSNKNSEKLKEKQKELGLKSDQLTKVEEKYRKSQQKLCKQLNELQNQMDQKYTAHLISQKQNNQKILNLEKQINRFETTNEKLKNQITQFEEFLFAGNQKNKQLNDSLKLYEEQIQKLKQQKDKLDENNNEIYEQVTEKEQKLMQLVDQIYNLELKLNAKQVQSNQKLEIFNSEWTAKCDSICLEYEQRINLIEKQKKMLFQNLEEQGNQYKKIQSENKLNENNLENIKRDYDEKVKSLNQEKLLISAQKNNEIQRITQENKQNFEKFKQKDTQLRKITYQLEIARTTITKLDFKSKQLEEKIKNVNKINQTQIQSLKKKEVNHKAFKQGLLNAIWKAERQVRKTVQYFIKNLLTVIDEKSSKGVMQLTKGLQQSLVSSMAIKIEEKQVNSQSPQKN